MKKLLVLLTVLALACFGLAGCGSNGGGNDKADKTITVGASPTPHAEILEVVKHLLAEQGYELKITEYGDYVIPNTALDSGEIDANYFQHITYMNNFNEENGTHLAAIANIHYEPMGLYAGKVATIEELADGATIGIPADPTNEARALLLLEAAGLITLNPDAGIAATPYDITDNPKNLNFNEMEAAQLPRALADLDMAVINGNYALQAGLSATKDALFGETADSLAATSYANVLAVKEGTENAPKLQALAKALQSQEVKDYIEATFNGNVSPLF